MKILALCGGRGLIDPELRRRIPKGMIRIGDRPIIWHILNTFASYGHREFVLALGEGGQEIRDFFMQYGKGWRDVRLNLADGACEFLDVSDREDWGVNLVNTGNEALTGSRLARCRRYVEDAPFMVTYSDCLSNVNLTALRQFHQAHGKVATITGVQPPSRFGTFFLADGQVTGYTLDTHLVGKGGYINGGFMMFEPRIFDYVDPFSECSLEVEVFQKLVQDGQVAIFPHNGYWQPVDTERDMQLLNNLYEQNQRPWLPEPSQLK
ncbi:MAG TPA: glucose-1-phosphate cytidylyltransferase [Verrucomicrobiae bacterium]|nr:glucose-1-phosphate cytidylyltransferase [Verrucomicrobiae bacterium]